MILSHKKKFIFIHIYKAAGTSIRETFKGYNDLRLQSFGPYRYLSDRFPKLVPNRFPRHITAADLQKVLKPEVFDSYFKFAFVRNPWDWHVSQYHYVLGKPRHHQHKLYLDKGFPAYIDFLMENGVTTQKSMLSDADGRLLVDFVGKMESIEDDLGTICDRIGLPRAAPKHANRSHRSRYQDYYDEQTRALIEEAYREDIQQFGYVFEA